MNRKEVVAKLAGRMQTSRQSAEVWLDEVLTVLQEAYGLQEQVQEVQEMKSNGTMGRAPVRSISAASPSAPAPTANADTASDVSLAAQFEERIAVPKNCVPAVLRPVSTSAQLTVGDEVAIDRTPFRVGREGRRTLGPGSRGSGELRANELFLKDHGKVTNVSREHFQVEAKEDGSYELLDRGSACGTIVAGRVVGGNFEGGRCPLSFGDTIVVGTANSSIVFEFDRAAE